MKKIYSVLFLILFLLLIPVFSFAEDELVKLLPEQMKGTRFKTPYEYKIYDDRSLYDYIDGGAPFYIEKGFQKLINYEYLEGDDSFIVDIYVMKDEKNSATLFNSVKKKDAKAVKIGKEGQEGTNQVEFFQDKYFVRITAFKTDSKTKETLKNFAQATSSNITNLTGKQKKK